MTPVSFVREKQRFWALRRGLAVDEKGYTTTLDGNLFEPMSKEVIQQFQDADGGELKSSKTHPPKMRALHSSSALAVNVFHYWRNRDQAPIAKAMEIPSRGMARLDFERLTPIQETVDRKIFPNDPNIDVVIGYRGSSAGEVGIESKFSEAYGTHDGLKTAYLTDESLWSGLPNCRKYAKRIQAPGNVEGLNTPQLLKHLLGLKHRSGIGKFWLVYLWYATPGPELGQHYQQLESFKAMLAEDGVRFHFLTYQELICRLTRIGRGEHSAYIDYLTERYL